MSSEQSHPNIDPFSLNGKRIGLHPNDKFKYTIESFSYPATIEVYDKDAGEKIPKIGYICIYRVKFNFANAGRKLVSYKVSNFDADCSDFLKEKHKKIIIQFLESNAETILANNINDTLLEWEELTENDPHSD